MSERASAAWVKILGGTVLLLVGALATTFLAGKAYGGDNRRLEDVDAKATKAIEAIEGPDGLRVKVATIDANVRTLLDRVPPR